MNMLQTLRGVVLALCLAPVASAASTIVGNPNASIFVVDGSDVYVHSVKAYRCSSGSQTVGIDATLDQWDSVGFSLAQGNYCDMVIRVRWSPGQSIQPVSVTGFDVLSIQSSSTLEWAIELDESSHTASLK